MRKSRTSVACLVCGAWLLVSSQALPQQPPAERSTDSDGRLVSQQQQIADHFAELEKLLLRMAELTASTDPRRATLLRQAVQQSKEKDIDQKFVELVALLKQERLSVAVRNQGQVQQELNRLLDLLLSEDRSKLIEEKKERTREYLKRVNRLITEQKGIQGETARGGDQRKLADRQGDLSDKTRELADDLSDDPTRNSRDQDAQDGNRSSREGRQQDRQDGKREGDESEKGQSEKSDDKKSEADKSGDSDQSKNDDQKRNQADRSSDRQKGRNSQNGKQSDQDKRSSQDKSSNGEQNQKDQEGKQGDRNDKGQQDKGQQKGDQSQKSQKSEKGEQGQKSQKQSQSQKGQQGSQSEKSQKSEKSQQGKQSQQGQQSQKGQQSQQGQKSQKSQKSSKSQKSQKGQQDQQDHQHGDDQQQSEEQQEPPSPEENTPDEPQQDQPSDNPAQQRLERAQERMDEAQKRLEEAEREQAVEEQAEALKQLEQARQELEEILRQLREEEVARMLSMLEGRFRKMLDAQVEVYEGTKRLDSVPEIERDRDDEIEAGRLSRKEKEIATEADRALAVLREEGSAVAVPEAVMQMRDDMYQVVARLSEAKTGPVTQGIEKDIISALEEMVAAFKRAKRDREEQQNERQQGEQQQMDGAGSEPPLVDMLAELKMIRALQMRVNQRTKLYAEMTKTEQAETPELLDALKKLAEREQRIHKVTRDISVGRNQ